MTTFDDRERAEETKFARDEDMAFRVQARRNRLLGEWAADKMGLADERRADYAKAVVKSDFEQPGDEDVYRKVMQDLEGSGLGVRESELRSKMDELLAVAREQIRNGE